MDEFESIIYCDTHPLKKFASTATPQEMAEDSWNFECGEAEHYGADLYCRLTGEECPLYQKVKAFESAALEIPEEHVRPIVGLSTQKLSAFDRK